MSRLLAGRYELVDKIGEGGMAVVYRAKDRLLNRFVAIKVLRPEYTRDDQFVESFKRESQAAAGLTHPNIVSVYDVGKTGNINYIVMELVDGRPLSEIIEEQGPMEYKAVIDIARQMASALSMAHKNQIIHRDVKPHNILVTKEGVAKLTDFGIAKAVSNASAMTDTSKIIGSVHYFSPEQARGSYVDERSDIYSLGIVMYEMLTGRVPFDGDNPVEVALKHINDEIIPPSKLVAGIPPNLEKLVMKATDKFQTNRYKSADEMLEDLANIEFVNNYLNGLAFYARENGKGKSRSTPIDEKEFDDIAAGKSSGGKTGGDSGKGGDIKILPKKKNDSSDDEDKGNKRTIFIVLGVLVLLAALGIFLVMAVSGMFGGGTDEIKVPDLLNKTYEQAESELKALGLDIKRGDDISSDDVAEGLVVQQMPVSGSNVKAGKVITVRISSGPGEEPVPDVTNKTFDEAKAILEEAGFGITTGDSVYSDSVEEGKIVSQSPQGNTNAKPGEVITVILSKGSEVKTVSVPYLIGTYYSSREEMEAYLSESGLHLGDVSESESSEDAGNIIGQSPAGGSEVEEGSYVNVVIATAPAKVSVPSLTGMTLTEATYMCEEKGLMVVLGDYVEDPTGAGTPGTVITQDIDPYSEVDPGTVVTVYIIKEPEPETEPTQDTEVDPDPSTAENVEDEEIEVIEEPDVVEEVPAE